MSPFVTVTKTQNQFMKCLTFLSVCNIGELPLPLICTYTELFMQLVFVSYITDRIHQDGESEHQEISLSSF